MIDYSKLPKVNLRGIAIAVALGIIAALALYQVQSKGLIPLNLSKNKLISELQTQIIVKEENAVINAVEKSSPSVVAIGVSRRVVNPFDPFAIPKREDSTIGTGFVVRQLEGDKIIIVTNKHVVANADKYSVVTKEGTKFDVKKIYRDPLLDLAIVQIEGAKLPALELGDSSNLKVGQTVIAIGNALGKYTNTVTTGVVSGLSRAVTAEDPYGNSLEKLDNLIQTDAAINPGNSGGPLLTSSGTVIGVNVATTEGAQNIGFAVPINSVKQIIEEFATKGSVTKPYLGVSYRFIAKDVAILNDIPQGAYIQDILPNSPAEKANVKVGDIITRINGEAIDKENKISEIIGKSKVGDRLEINLFRDEKEIKVTTTIEEFPNQ